MGLILCGHQRSGTTLLQSVCNSHPDVTVTMEMGSFLSLDTSYRDYARHMMKTWWTIKNQWRIHPKYRFLRGNLLANFALIRNYLRHLRRHANQTINASNVELGLRKTFRTPIVGDKWPDYLRLLNDSRSLDGQQILICYRHPLDVTSSTLQMARTRWKSQPWVSRLDTAEKVAQRWVRAMQMMERHESKVHAVRYEDLVKQPQTFSRHLGQWLGVDPNRFDVSSIQSKSVDSYRKRLTPEEIETVVQIAGPRMEQTGYCRP